MLRIYSFLVLLLFLHSYSEAADNYASGISSIVGNIYPTEDAPGIHLNNEIIQLRDLDTSVSYSILYELSNTENDYKAVDAITPIRIYFTDFKPDTRSPLIDKMSGYFPDIFKVDEPYADIKNQIKSNFGKRLFIRKFVNSIDLSRIGIYFSFQKEEEKLYVKRISIDFRWVEAEIADKRYTEVLMMDIKIYNELLFRPKEEIKLIARLNMPTLICGTSEKQIYAPYQLIHKNRWGNNPGNIYVINNVFEATLTLPKYYTYKSYPVNQEDILTIISDYQVGKDEKIAFYSRKNITADCGDKTVFKDKVYIPKAIKNIRASSWLTSNKMVGDRNISVIKELSLSSVIQEFQAGEGEELNLFKGNIENVEMQDLALNRFLLNSCEGQEVNLELNEYCHPLYAFLMSENSAVQDRDYVPLSMKTAWCESASGDGSGEYLEFELSQPAKSMRIYNGYRFDENKYALNSRLRTIRLERVGSDFVLNLPVSDLKILNLYEVRLEPGKYRLSITGIFEGDYPTTCLASIYFDFEVEDDWFNRNYALMSGKRNP